MSTASPYIEVVKMLAIGNNAKEIARKKNMSIRSVYVYTHRAMRLLNARTPQHAVAIVVASLLVEPEAVTRARNN